MEKTPGWDYRVLAITTDEHFKLAIHNISTDDIWSLGTLSANQIAYRPCREMRLDFSIFVDRSYACETGTCRRRLPPTTE
jgi:hypothetical protein